MCYTWLLINTNEEMLNSHFCQSYSDLYFGVSLTGNCSTDREKQTDQSSDGVSAGTFINSCPQQDTFVVRGR